MSFLFSGRVRLSGRAKNFTLPRILKKELIYRRAFADLGQLRREPSSYVWWRNEKRMHSTLGYMSPVEFRNVGLSL